MNLIKNMEFKKNNNNNKRRYILIMKNALSLRWENIILFQALIAETVGDEDAMDLFRHTTELSTHVSWMIH